MEPRRAPDGRGAAAPGSGESAPEAPARLERVHVVATADQGMALAYVGGKVAFIPFAAPGDVLDVRVVREKPRYLEASIVRIVAPSPVRREPGCPHFGPCGGCQWQHLPYPDQLAAKARSFAGFLGNRLGLAPERILAPIASPAEWGYRNRIGLKVRQAGSGLLLGYHARRTHRIVPISRCPIAKPCLEALLPALRAFLSSFGPARGCLPQVDLQADGLGRRWATFHLLRPASAAEAAQLEAFAAGHDIVGLTLQRGRKESSVRLGGGPDRLPFRLRAGRELTLSLAPGGFVQANDKVNQALVDAVRELAPEYAGRIGLDLYCGAGNFTLPLALEAASVVGIEGYPPGAEDARRNAGENGLGNVRILGEPVEGGLERLRHEGFTPHFALLDPPREGALGALEPLARLAPSSMLYVSCSPPTLVRDLGVLAGLGYRVEWSRMADMFPQTAHAESLTFLRRVGAL